MQYERCTPSSSDDVGAKHGEQPGKRDKMMLQVHHSETRCHVREPTCEVAAQYSEDGNRHQILEKQFLLDRESSIKHYWGNENVVKHLDSDLRVPVYSPSHMVGRLQQQASHDKRTQTNAPGYLAE